VRTGRVAGRLDDYRRLATASTDPWLIAIADQETAKAEIGRGERAAGEARLRDAMAAAQRAHRDYRVALRQQDLVDLNMATQSLARAHEDAQAVYRQASALGEGVLAMKALVELAAINQDRYANGLARAYLTEIREATGRSASVGPSPVTDDTTC